MNQCPDCGKPFSIKTKRCSCGWVKPEVQKCASTDYRCQHTAANRRCSLPGTICSSPYSNGPWYCAKHWQAFNDLKLVEAVRIPVNVNNQ